jgi:hypothetical protein
MMYVKFPLSLRNVEDLLHGRGIDLCHETVRFWWNRLSIFSAEIRRRRVEAMRQHTHWRWRLDEVYVKINGEIRYLWRAVDQEGEVLECFATKTRDKAAALKFMKKTLRRHGSGRRTGKSAVRISDRGLDRGGHTTSVSSTPLHYSISLRSAPPKIGAKPLARPARRGCARLFIHKSHCTGLAGAIRTRFAAPVPQDNHAPSHGAANGRRNQGQQKSARLTCRRWGIPQIGGKHTHTMLDRRPRRLHLVV